MAGAVRRIILRVNQRLKEGLDLAAVRSEEHTSELQSPCNLVCRLLLEKKKILAAAPRFEAVVVEVAGWLGDERVDVGQGYSVPRRADGVIAGLEAQGYRGVLRGLAHRR